MAKVTFTGGDPLIFGNIGFTTWPIGPAGNRTEITFPLNKAVEVTDKHVLSKIRGMGEMSPFKVEEEGVDPTTHGHGASADAGHSDEDDDATAHGGTLKHSGERQRKIR